MSSYSPMIEKVHNFGIYLKKGKRAILQLDFPGKACNIIQRGHVKRSFRYQDLVHFDSAEDLHIVLQADDADVEFQADNSEEKYTICRLLSLVIDLPSDEYQNLGLQSPSKDKGGVSVLPPVSLRQEKVLKDGILEKKGNTTITTWNKRRVKISAGEFSYYKPGDELALNIVQIWDGATHVKRIGNNGFNVVIRDARTYSFRCIHDAKSKLSIEDERDEWLKCFEKAIRTRRNTLVYIDDTLLSSNQSKNNEDNYPEDELSPYTEVEPIDKISSPPYQQSRNPEITAHLSVSVNYVSDKSQDLSRINSTSPVSTTQTVLSSKVPIHVPSPSRLIPKPPEPIYSLQTSIPDVKSERTTTPPEMTKPNASTAVVKPFGTCDIAVERGKDEPSVADARAMFEERSKNNGDGDGLNKDRRVRLNTPPEPPSNIPVPPAPDLSESIFTCAGPPPPPPPPLNVKKAGVKLSVTPSTKLKPAHWTKISNTTASSSIWKDMRDVTKNLNLAILEDKFAVKEKEDKRISKEITDYGKQTPMLDQKRAHVLGIIVNGMKIAGHISMLDILSTVKETDTFPSETLSTIRSCQPTDDDIEMYKAYKGSKDDLTSVDKFMMELCEVPKIGLRLELLQIIWDFPKTFDEVQEEVDDIWLACDEVVGCTKLVNVLQYVLAIGNQLNAKWSSGYGARGFEITSIDKVLEVKGKENITVLNYLISTLKKNDPDLLDWPATLGHVAVSSEYSVKAITAEIEVLKNDIMKVKKHMKVLKPLLNTKTDKLFQSDVQAFVIDNEKKLEKLDGKSHQLSNKYKRTLELFGEQLDRPSDVFFFCINKFMENFQQARGKAKK